MNALEIINEYDNIVSKLGETIKNSPYKTKFFLDLLDIKSSFFYKKIREKRFTSEEVKLISQYIYPTESIDYEISEALKRSQEDSKAGRVKSHDEVMKNARKKVEEWK